MKTEKTNTVVVGAGQAGIAMSEHLKANSISHIVLERERIAERWRTGRWDKLVANGPAWHDRFPNLEFQVSAPDEFPPKDEVVAYFEKYAEMIDAPIRSGVEVIKVTRMENEPGFRVETSAGIIEAQHVVAATGPFQQPVVPPIVPDDAKILQIHSHDYKNPEQLPEGAVLVVGAGSSGAQIADELNCAGKRIFLSVGKHDRPPRSYRGRDFVWWLGVLGKWDIPAPAPGTEHVTIAVSGAQNGKTIDFRQFASNGVTLVGITQSFADGVLRFAPDLADNIAGGDENYLSLLNEADEYIARNGLDLPPEPQAKIIGPDPECITNPVLEIDLAKEKVGTIIWATGFSTDYTWLAVDTFDETGKPIHQRGVSPVPGIYFIGLPWLSRRGSSFIWGVWHDAKHVADQINIQNQYKNYRPSAGSSVTDP